MVLEDISVKGRVRPNGALVFPARTPYRNRRQESGGETVKVGFHSCTCWDDGRAQSMIGRLRYSVARQ